ncbi:hypothetical protein OL229_09030 [Neisseriaceae bacterium JH1-16]|nr:hypothetical protein [Neisseriaceae bacterium JH1-16]
MPEKNLYSANEIAGMKLSGLPSSKGKIIERAASEGWYFEERKGIGGTRRVYEIPARYLPTEQSQEESAQARPAEQIGKVAGTIVAGSAQIDLEMLQLVEATLEEWLQSRGLRLKPDRRGAIVAVLYDYLAKGASQEDMVRMLKAMAA